MLDPAQNDSFTDHYLGVPFDLSEVMFIATANFLQNIPGPLLDRMEVVDFSGYTEREKLAIAKQYLVPRQLEENGLAGEQLDAHRRRDPRGDHRLHARGRRAPARARARPARAQGRAADRRRREVERRDARRADVRPLLGRPRVHPEKASREDQVGIATGMYYTPAGGDIMFVEAAPMRGKGELILTGQLGDVMKESARAAWTFARSHADWLGDRRARVRARPPRPRPGGRDPEGRAVGGHRDGDGDGLGAVGPPGAPRRRDDRRDHAVGPRAADRRAQGEGPRRRPRGHHAHRDPARQRARPRGPAGRGPRALEVSPVDTLGEALAITLRDTTFRDGRLRFGEPATTRARGRSRTDRRRDYLARRPVTTTGIPPDGANVIPRRTSRTRLPGAAASSTLDRIVASTIFIS